MAPTLTVIKALKSTAAINFCFQRWGCYTELLSFLNNHKKKISLDITRFYLSTLGFKRKRLTTEQWHCLTIFSLTATINPLWINRVSNPNTEHQHLLFLLAHAPPPVDKTVSFSSHWWQNKANIALSDLMTAKGKRNNQIFTKIVYSLK